MSTELKLSFISLVFLVKIYPVVLPHEISENLKWNWVNRFALNANYSIFNTFFLAFLSEMSILKLYNLYI